MKCIILLIVTGGNADFALLIFVNCRSALKSVETTEKAPPRLGVYGMYYSTVRSADLLFKRTDPAVSPTLRRLGAEGVEVGCARPANHWVQR
jgi:hypothetical protein